ncbi:hypothetical protein [Conexibacter sp. SYSU D00693]|uniref:hypothetical protein n=1 Tax=Conexibacter sp. SYSU D00693 TaxID=2812560 RepID=UPI00196AC06F|nr:hypothetical protein [Conexibacter sp. SYSU D00693]
MVLRPSQTLRLIAGELAFPGSMRMRQELAQLEQAFVEEAEAARLQRERLQRQAQIRSYERHRRRAHKRGTLRFTGLVLVLIATAVLVTLAMFQTLYIVMG